MQEKEGSGGNSQVRRLSRSDIICLTPVRAKNIPLFRLDIGTKLSKHRQALTCHAQKCRCPGTFTVENLEGNSEDLKSGLWGPQEYLNTATHHVDPAC